MTPLEDISVMSPIDKLSDAIILLLVALVVALTNHVTNRFANKKIKEVQTQVQKTQTTVDQVKTSITENNGGSSVKDYFDKIIAKQGEHDLKFKYLENQQNHIAEKQDILEAKQDHHSVKFDAVHERIEKVDDKLDAHITEGLGRVVKRKKR